MSLTCQTCGGLIQREPAVVRCTNCGRFGIVLDASHEDRLRQSVLDWWLRPRSVECCAEFNIPAPSSPPPGRGWVRLPDPSRAKRARLFKAPKGAAGNGHMPLDHTTEEVGMATDSAESAVPRINPLISELRALRGQSLPEIRAKAVELAEAIWLSRKYDSQRKHAVSYMIEQLMAK